MKGQKGITLVELIVAVAATGIIVTFLGTVIHQILTVSEYGNDRFSAMHELQNASYWFTYDSQQAVSAVADTGLVLTGSDNTTVAYDLIGTELRRTAGPNQMVVAREIAGALFTVDNRTVSMWLASEPPGRDAVSQNATYQVFLRPAEGN